MKQSTIILIILILFIVKTHAQNENYKPPQGLNNWYVEFGGAGLFYSINYEKYLFRNNNENLTWLGRVGFGYNPIEGTLLNKIYLDKSSFMFPFATSLLIGAGKEKIEIGAGYTLLNKNFGENEAIPTGILGFRVMEKNSVCFRVSYTPLLRNNQLIQWFGVSLGKNFSIKNNR